MVFRKLELVVTAGRASRGLAQAVVEVDFLEQTEQDSVHLFI